MWEAVLYHREEQLAIRKMEVATRVETLEHRESQVSQDENSLVAHEREIMVRVEEQVEKVRQDYHEKLERQEKRCQDRVCRVEEEKDCRIKELEEFLKANGRSQEILSIHAEELRKEVDFPRREVEATEERCEQIIIEMAHHVELLNEVFWHVQRSTDDARFGHISASELGL